MRVRRLAIIGGGFSGVALALRALHAAGRALSVAIIEPRAAPGQGLAYSSADPDHRLNAPTAIHFALPDALDGLDRWIADTATLATDPEASTASGGVFLRRRDFAAYLSHLLKPHLVDAFGSPGICHIPARALDLARDGEALSVRLDQGADVNADAVALATGWSPAPPPPPFDDPRLHGHHGFLAQPWDHHRLGSVDRDAAVLIVGTGLTTFDIMVSLLRHGHRGRITAVSRRGLRPQPQAPPTGKPPTSPWLNIQQPVPEFIAAQPGPHSLRSITRSLRRQIRDVERAGGTWHGPFDELRDCVWQLWPAIGEADKRRYRRHLQPYYDSHRFRLPPQTGQIVANAEATGQVQFRAARVIAVTSAGERFSISLRGRGVRADSAEQFNVIVNCTGVVTGPGDDHLSGALVSAGLARPHPSGLGWDVDDACRAFGTDGTVVPRLFVIGPPSVGAWGDPIGAPFIVAQIDRIMPALRSALKL